MTELTDKEQEYVGLPRSQLPRLVRWSTRLNSGCNRCGESLVGNRKSLKLGDMCYGCGSLSPHEVSGLTEQEQNYVDTPREDLPETLSMGFGNFDECEECGADTVSYRVNRKLKKGKMCFDCGRIQTPDKPANAEKPDSEGKSKAEAREEATRNTGKMLQMVGVLFCLTIVGAIIGIPLLVVGMRIETKGMEDKDD